METALYSKFMVPQHTISSVFSRAGSAGCRPAPGLYRPATKRAAGWLNRAQIELSENVYLISVALLVTEIWPFKVWVKKSL